MSAGRPPVVLVTGFEPFGGSTLNPSQRIVDALAEEIGNEPNFVLRTAVLPVDTRRAPASVHALWDAHDPDVVLHFGESAKADRVTLERVALNLLDFDTPDNEGRMIHDTPIDPRGPAARFATLPVRAVKQRLEAAGHPAALSLTAGAYLCNQVLYTSLAIGETRGGRCVGFVHVPSLPEQVAQGERDEPSMPGEDLLQAAAAVVRAAVALHALPSDT